MRYTILNVINLKAIITSSIVIDCRQLSIEFITLKELHRVERIISQKAGIRGVVLSAADSIGNVYRPLIQLSVLIDCQAAPSLLAFSLSKPDPPPLSLFLKVSLSLYILFTIPASHILPSLLSSDFHIKHFASR